MNDIPDAANQHSAPSPLASAPAESRYKGVGGWLLLFCLGLTVFNPLLTLGLLAVSYSETSQCFGQFPGLLVIAVIDILLSVGIMAFSVYAGTGLWRIRPGAVQMAKRYLLCFLGYLVVAAILPFMAGLPSAANEVMITQIAKDTFGGVIFVAIWYSYLNKSKRVRATYHNKEEQVAAMNVQLVREIRRTMDAKPTEELTQIYRRHDEEAWSSEAFEAIRQVLFARGKDISVIDPSLIPSKRPIEPTTGKINRLFKIMLILGIPIVFIVHILSSPITTSRISLIIGSIISSFLLTVVSHFATMIPQAICWEILKRPMSDFVLKVSTWIIWLILIYMFIIHWNSMVQR